MPSRKAAAAGSLTATSTSWVRVCLPAKCQPVLLPLVRHSSVSACQPLNRFCLLRLSLRLALHLCALRCAAAASDQTGTRPSPRWPASRSIPPARARWTRSTSGRTSRAAARGPRRAPPSCTTTAARTAARHGAWSHRRSVLPLIRFTPDYTSISETRMRPDPRRVPRGGPQACHRRHGASLLRHELPLGAEQALPPRQARSAPVSKPTASYHDHTASLRSVQPLAGRLATVCLGSDGWVFLNAVALLQGGLALHAVQRDRGAAPGLPLGRPLPLQRLLAGQGPRGRRWHSGREWRQ